MGFVVLGLLAVILKMFGWTIVAGWSWWIVLSPFVAAALWWTLADLTGRTRLQAQRRHEQRIERRRRHHLEAMGMTANKAGAENSSGGEPPRQS